MSLRKTVTYVDNRGQEHDVRHMDTSHILNVLNLIRNQQNTTEYFAVDYLNTEVQECLDKSLNKDAKVLCAELNRRFRKGGCSRLKETA